MQQAGLHLLFSSLADATASSWQLYLADATASSWQLYLADATAGSWQLSLLPVMRSPGGFMPPSCWAVMPKHLRWLYAAVMLGSNAQAPPVALCRRHAWLCRLVQFMPTCEVRHQPRFADATVGSWQLYPFDATAGSWQLSPPPIRY